MPRRSGESGEHRSVRAARYLGALLGCLQWQSFAAAQEPVRRFELTPYAAFRFGGTFDDPSGDRGFDLDENAASGLLLNIRAAAPNGYWEALYAHQPTELETQSSFTGGPLLDVDVDYLHFGGLYVFDGQSARPFVGMTVGATHFSPTPAGYDSETYFSGSFGGGIQLNASKRVGVRLEGRVFASLVDSDGALFCRTGPTSNTCAIVMEGSMLIQWEARAGVVFRF